MGQTDSCLNCTTEDKKIKDFTLNNVVVMKFLCIYCVFTCICCGLPVDTETGLARIPHQAPSRGHRDAVVLGRTDYETLKGHS